MQIQPFLQLNPGRTREATAFVTRVLQELQAGSAESWEHLMGHLIQDPFHFGRMTCRLPWEPQLASAFTGQLFQELVDAGVVTAPDTRSPLSALGALPEAWQRDPEAACASVARWALHHLLSRFRYLPESPTS